MNIYKVVSELNLPDGHTKRMKCPNCGQRTFTVTNNLGSLVFNCYRISCGTKGGTRVMLTVEDIKKNFRGGTQAVEEDFVLPEYVIPHQGHSAVLKWASRWGLDADELDLMYDVKEDRVVFPVMHDGVMVDATGRSLGKLLPKWKRYGKNGLPYIHGYGRVAVLVEDCVSAAVVGSASFVGVALLGTSLAQSHKSFVSQFSTAIIALDPDALPKALSMAKELRGYVSDVKVLRLTDDLKYRKEIDLTNLTNMI